MTYGIGTHSHLNSTEHRQMKRERAEFTKQWEGQERGESLSARCAVADRFACRTKSRRTSNCARTWTGVRGKKFRTGNMRRTKFDEEMAMFKKAKQWLREWWRCRTKRCDYYTDYLAYGGPELTHEGFHSACRKADAHFKSCRWSGDDLCPACSRWEKAIRA